MTDVPILAQSKKLSQMSKKAAPSSPTAAQEATIYLVDGGGSGGITVDELLKKAGRYSDTVQAKSITSTGSMDVSTANCFTIDGTVATTVALTGTVVNRAQAIVVIIEGTGGAVTWPAGIFWDANTEPTLGATRTVVTLLFDGLSWAGNVFASA